MLKQEIYDIPKVIHYVWFGKNPKTKSIKKCIASWRKYCPDYKIIEWNETNYNIRKNRYMYEAYKAKKWAFASDYARYDIIYQFGGIYLDTDVELVASMDPLLHNKMFMCFLEDKRLNSGLGFGSIPHNPIIKDILDYYNNRSFYKPNGKMDLTICNHNETRVLVRHGMVRNGKEQWLDDAHIYPREYLNPQDGIRTKRTIAVNHFEGSWATFAHKTRLKKNAYFIKMLGRRKAAFIIRLTDPIWNIFDRIEKIRDKD